MNIDLILANLVVAFAGFVQASVGIGFAMIAVPLLVLIDTLYAPGPSLFVMLFLAIAMVAGAWRDIDYGGLKTLFPGLVVGTIGGTFLLGALTSSSFEIVFGGIVLAALVLSQLGLAPERTPAVFGAGGFIAGLMGTISGIHGPPLAVLYQQSRQAAARATIAFVFVIASILSLVSLNSQDLFGRAELNAGLALFPGLIAGYALSLAGREYISETFARNLMLAVAAISSLILIGKNII